MSGSISGTTAALIGMAVATVGSAAGMVYSGMKQAEAEEYNAKVREQAARAAQDKAAYDEQLHRDRVKKLLSTQRALYGASGVQMSGSPLLTLEDTAGQGELDALAIRHGGNVEASQQRSAATLSRMQGKAALTSSYIQAGSTLLSGASNTYAKAKGQ